MLAESKKQLRIRMKRVLAQISVDSRAEQSRQLANHVGSWIMSNQAIGERGIGLFASSPLELDTDPLDKILIELGIKRCIPIWSFDDSNMGFYAISPAIPASEYAYMYSQHPPRKKLGPLVQQEEIGVLITPALAFDLFGNRLGRGMGYYDRYIEEAKRNQPSIETMVVGLDEQLLPQVPVEPWDQQLDWIATSHIGVVRKN